MAGILLSLALVVAASTLDQIPTSELESRHLAWVSYRLQPGKLPLADDVSVSPTTSAHFCGSFEEIRRDRLVTAVAQAKSFFRGASLA